MLILFTGATGFIGGHVFDILKKDDRVNLICLSRKKHKEGKNFRFVKADILSSAGLQKIEKSDVLLHLAWITSPAEYWNSPENIKWIFWSFELVKRFAEMGGRKVVVAGTCAEYDWSFGLLSEARTPLSPHSIYGASKTALFLLLSNFCRENKIDFAWLRVFFAFGPGERKERFIPSTILSLLSSGKATCIKSEISRDFIYVRDVADVFVKAVFSDKVKGALNVGTGRALSLEQIAKKIEKICGGKVKLLSKQDNYPIVVADTSKLKKIKRGFTDIDNALRETVDWWKRHFL